MSRWCRRIGHHIVVGVSIHDIVYPRFGGHFLGAAIESRFDKVFAPGDQSDLDILLVNDLFVIAPDRDGTLGVVIARRELDDKFMPGSNG